MNMRSRSAAAAVAIVLLFAQAVPSRAADVTVLAANALRSALIELAPRFERDTAHRLVMAFGLTGGLKRQIEAGEAFDVAILPPDLIGELAGKGKVAPDG